MLFNKVILNIFIQKEAFLESIGLTRKNIWEELGLLVTNFSNPENC